MRLRGGRADVQPPAISLLDRPLATSASTSRSRAVITSSTPTGEWAAGAAGGRRANSSTSRRVTDGASSASPAAMTWIAVSSSAGEMLFSRKPLAPARSAEYTYSSRSNVVRMSTRTSLVAAVRVICRVASMPSISGIRTSISTTSGMCRRACSTASAPVPASPTTSKPAVAATMPRKPARTRAWSSATSTRSVMNGNQRQPGPDHETATGTRRGAELAAAQAHPLPHADDAVPGPLPSADKPRADKPTADKPSADKPCARKSRAGGQACRQRGLDWGAVHLRRTCRAAVRARTDRGRVAAP